MAHPLLTVKSPMVTPVTDSGNVRVTGIGYVAVTPERDDVRVTVGAVVSTISALLYPREPAAPGDARVRTASFPAVSRMVPPLSARAEVET